MCFATAMTWQGLFIYIMSNTYRDYYFQDVFLLRDELEGSVGYIFLAAMVVTSFSFVRQHLNSTQWKLIHKSGIYFLWAYAFSVYWWNLFYYKSPEAIDYIYYWSGFLAFTVRIAVWGIKRQRVPGEFSPVSSVPLAYRVSGVAIIVVGLVAAATGLYWQKPVTAFLTAPQWSADLVLWLPFWPFEPFISIFLIGLGCLLATRTISHD
jgi:hypothetical protein